MTYQPDGAHAPQIAALIDTAEEALHFAKAATPADARAVLGRISEMFEALKQAPAFRGPRSIGEIAIERLPHYVRTTVDRALQEERQRTDIRPQPATRNAKDDL